MIGIDIVISIFSLEMKPYKKEDVKVDLLSEDVQAIVVEGKRVSGSQVSQQSKALTAAFKTVFNSHSNLLDFDDST